ncbi:MFS transporter [Kribbella endophytica]
MPQTLWADREFIKLWVGQTVSQLGAQTAQLTLPLVALTALGGGAAQMGVLRAAQQIPVLLCSLFVGVLVDRMRARGIMMYADLGRALLLAIVPFAFSLSYLYVVAFLLGVLSVFFDVAYQASLPRLVPRDQLAQGNSLLESSRSVTQISGPALGGGLVSLLTAPIAVVAGAVFYLLSFLSIQRIRRPERRGPVVPTKLTGGLRLVFGTSTLRAIAVASAVGHFFLAGLMTVYLVYLAQVLALPAGIVGLVMAALGPGALIGAVFSAAVPRRFGYGRVMILAAIGADLALLLVLVSPGVAGLIAINLVFGALTQLIDVAATAVRQVITPLNAQGQVVATLNFLGMGLTPLGSLLAGVVAEAVGVREVLLICALGMLLSPLAMALSPLAKLGRTLPDQQDQWSSQ